MGKAGDHADAQHPGLAPGGQFGTLHAFVEDGAGDIISTTQDLHTYFSALSTGKLIPATLLAEMRKTHPDSGSFFGEYGLGLFVKDDLGPGCGTVVTHSGSAPGGYGALMYSSPDGKKTLTASITTGDAAKDPAAAFPAALDKLLNQVFCGTKATG